MKDIDSLEQLFIAIRDLRKAERKSKELCAEMAKAPTGYTRNHWTKAAIERDRCFEYAERLAKEYFTLNEN